ncbi:hypothetical protein CHS0354_029007, partial [Potamilus streckersoni]
GTGCTYGLQSVTGPDNKNEIFFPNISSPSVVNFKFETWLGNSLVRINVTDVDSDGSQLVDYFALNHSQIAGYNFSITSQTVYNITGTRDRTATRILLGIAVYCDQHYYGPQCAIKCVGQNDCNGHYVCDEQGHKKCSPGWDGINCTIQISGGEADCSVYEDQREFIPSEWTGKYSCPLQANVSLTLNVTKSENRIEVAGSLMFFAFNLPFSGTYASVAKFLTVQTAGNIISIDGKNYSSVELNLFLKDSVTMNGSIVFLGPMQMTCALYLIRQAVYFGGCNLQGTCIRYGPSKNQYFCCCNDGFIGQHCEVSTATTSIVTSSSTKTTSNTIRTSARTTKTTNLTMPALSGSTKTTPSTPHNTTPKTTIQINTAPTNPNITSAPSTISTAHLTVSNITTSSTTPTTTNSITSATTIIPSTTTKSPTSTATSVTTIITAHTPSTSLQPNTTYSTKSTIHSSQPPSTISTAQTTTQPTPTKLVTTSMQSTSKPSTASTSTTSTTFTTTPSITSTTLLTTTTPAEVAVKGKNYSFHVELVKEEYNQNSFLTIISNAWIKANAGLHLNSSVLEVNISSWDALIDREGVEILGIFYTVQVHVNWNKSLVVPGHAIMEQEVQASYNSQVYRGQIESLISLEFSFHINIEGPGLAEEEKARVERAINTTWATNSSMLAVTILKMEEYVGEDGQEVTKIYYFISKKQIYLHPTSVTLPNQGILETNIRNEVSTIKFYSGTLLWRYRFHYSLYVEEHVYTENLQHFSLAVSQLWAASSSVSVCSVGGCIVNISRTEKYLTYDGNTVVEILYFVHKGGNIFSPFLVATKGPDSQQLRNIRVISPKSNSSYIIYIRTGILYRLSFSQELYIQGRVDVKDTQKIMTSLTQAWTSHLIGFSMQLHFIRVELCLDSQGSEVSRIIYFLMNGGHIQDGRSMNSPTINWLDTWFRNTTHMVITGSGQAYNVYTEKTDQVLRKTQYFTVFINGYTWAEDKNVLQNIIQRAWTEKYTGYNFSVTIVKEEISYTSEGDVVTAFVYRLSTHFFVDPELEYRFNRTVVLTTIERILVQGTNLKQSYSLYDFREAIYTADSCFSLTFSTKLAIVDFIHIQTALNTSLSLKWKDYAYYQQGFSVRVLRQEKVYIQQKWYWMVQFTLHYKSGLTIYPKFVTTVNEILLEGSLSVTGVGGYRYQLYMRSQTAQLYWYSYSFGIYFEYELYKADWDIIMVYLKMEWCKRLYGSTSCSNITITVTGQEHWIDIHGKSLWKLVYYVSVNNSIVSAVRDHNWAYSLSIMNFNSTFGFTFSSVNISRSGIAGLLPFSYIFSLYTNITISTEYRQTIIEAIINAWKAHKSVSIDWSQVSLHIMDQVAVKTGGLSSKWVWRILYYLTYRGRQIDSTTWPTFDVNWLQSNLSSSVPIWFYSDLNLQWLDYYFHVYLRNKVSIKDYVHFERIILQTWYSTHTEYRGCGCVSVQVKSQEEVVDQGISYWQLNYNLIINGTVIRSSDLPPLNYSVLQSFLNFTGPQGNYIFHPSIDFVYRPVSYQYYSGLYLKQWLPSWNYEYIVKLLTEYYREHWTAWNFTSLTVYLTTQRHYLTYTGSWIWKLPFFVKVDEKVIHPDVLPPIDWNWIYHRLNITTPQGTHYEFYNSTDVTTVDTTFTIHTTQMVSTSNFAQFETAIKLAWLKQNTEYNESDVDVHIKTQEEVIDTNGHSHWAVYYTLSVNGIILDSRDTTSLNVSTLQGYLTFLGPTGVKYDLSYINTSISGTVNQRNLMSIYLNHYVRIQDRDQVEEKILQAWNDILRSSDHYKGNLSLKFVRQKEYLKTGYSIWKWDYFLLLNGSHIHPDELLKIDLDKVKSHLANTTTITKYQVENATTSFYDYHLHFPLYVKGMVAFEQDKAKFEEKLLKAWKAFKPNWLDLKVEITHQEELVDNIGNSVWELVYFVTRGNTTVDSREQTWINKSAIETIMGPKGAYVLVQKTSNLIRYSKNAFYFYVNNKFDKKGLDKLKASTVELIENIYIDLKGKVSLEINRHEEYIDSSGLIIWKVVYFVMVNGMYIPSEGLENLNQSKLQEKLNFTSVQNQSYHILEVKDQHVYRYREKFSIFLKSKISRTSFSWFQTTIKTAWEKQIKEYQICRCLNVTVNSLEEVLDENGKSYWLLTYFLIKNTSLVNSMISVSLNLSILREGMNSSELHAGTVVEEQATIYRTSQSFAFYLSTEIGYQHSYNFELAIERAWKKKNEEFPWMSEPRVTIKRTMRYVQLISSTVIWRVEYFLGDICVGEGCSMLDPQTLPLLTAADVQAQINFTRPGLQQNYTVVNTGQSVVDYRYHFSLYLTTNLRDVDRNKFENIIRRIWNTTQDESTHGDIKVFIPTTEEYVFTNYFGRLHGKSYWKVVIFIEQNGTMVDSEVSTPFNETAVLEKIDFAGAHNMSYQVVVGLNTNQLLRYEYTVSFFITAMVKYEDIQEVVTELEYAWTTFAIHACCVEIQLVRQEDHISLSRGLITKFVFVVSLNGTVTSKSKLPYLTHANIQEAMNTTRDRYKVLDLDEVSEVIQYNKLFKINLKHPLLDVDRMKFQEQLTQSWRSFTKVSAISTEIIFQEEKINTKTSEMSWQLHYSVMNGSLVYYADEQDDIAYEELRKGLSLNVTGTSASYSSYVEWSKNLTTVRSIELFSIYVQYRVATNDFNKFETSLINVWNKNGTDHGEQKVQSASIIRTEEVVNDKLQYAWKLSYTLTTKENVSEMTARNTKDLSFEMIAGNFQINSTSGQSYKLVNIENGLQLTKTFQVVLSRQLYKVDTQNFTAAFKNSVAHFINGNPQDLTLMLVHRESVYSVSTGQKGYKLIFIAKVNGSVVDASLQQRIPKELVQQHISFKTPRREEYIVYSTGQSENFRKDSELFEWRLMSIVPKYITDGMTSVLIASWTEHLKGENLSVNISGLQRDEFISNNEVTGTRLRYFMDVNGSRYFPIQTTYPEISTLVNKTREILNYTVHSYAQENFYPLSTCYKVLIHQRENMNLSQLNNVLQGSWNKSTSESVKITVVQKSSYVGLYGLQLTGVYYAVHLNESLMEPEYIIEPDNSVIQKVAEDTGASLQVYQNKPSFRVSDLHRVQITGTLTKTTRKKLQNALIELWSSASKTEIRHINASIELSEEYFSKSGSHVISSLLYTVAMDNKMVASWELRPLDTKSMETKINTFLNGSHMLWTGTATKVHVLNLHKSTASVNPDKVKAAITEAWQSKVTASSTVFVNLIEFEKQAVSRFVDSSWSFLNSIRYAVYVNSSTPEELAVDPVSTAEMNKALQKHQLQGCECTAKKLYKLYIKGSKASQNKSELQIALGKAWNQSNEDVNVNSFAVNVKQQGSRMRRAASKDFTLIGNNEEEISPLEFTVSHGQEEPNDMFVDIPDNDTLDRNLKDAKTEMCHCEPKARGNVKLDGATKKDEVPKIANAVKDAVNKENPEVKKEDLNVEVSRVADGKDQDGKEISDVEYIVQCNQSSCDIETLKAPSEVHLEASLNEIGKNLYSRAEPVKDKNNNDWVIPVAVACGVLAFIILVAIICCCLAKRRHSKKGDLVKQEEEVEKNNSYDQEHFSDAAVFNNPSYDMSEVHYKQKM